MLDLLKRNVSLSLLSLGVLFFKESLMQCTTIELITARMHMYTQHNTAL